MSSPDQHILDLALNYYRMGRHFEAETLYRQVLARQPESAGVIHMLGVIARETGHLDKGLELMQRSVRADPKAASYHNNLGLLLADMNRLEESATALETALRLEPENPLFRYNFGNTRRLQARWEEAIAAYRAALQIQPLHAHSWLNLGLTLASANRQEEAIAAYRTGQSYFPEDHTLAVNLASVFQDNGRVDEAIAAVQSALKSAPNNPILLNNLGMLHKDRGEISEAIKCLRKSLAQNRSAEIHSNAICTMLFDPVSTEQMIWEEQRRWNLHYAAPLRTQRPRHVNDPSPTRRLRIGYVSLDLRQHVVGRTLLPIFEAHDRSAVECVCYASESTDTVAQRFQARADHWRTVQRWTDGQLAAQIYADRIDILVDLGLHTAYNRLQAFAYKPAPVQVSWLGFPGSAGVETIDYWLTDDFLDPPKKDFPEFSGQPFHLPDAWCCYHAPEDAPEVNPLPALETGCITFGSFNNFAKINDCVLELWARILQALPGSRLVLVAKTGIHQTRAGAALEKYGVAADRCTVLDYLPASLNRTAGDYLRRYADIDIALDPFPYNGMTTTCDALWMGVPVVAHCGTTCVSRASFSLLSNLGLSELVASTEDEYLQIAVCLASNMSRLQGLRAALRGRMRASPLLDIAGFARNLEGTYRTMWGRWCARISKGP